MGNIESSLVIDAILEAASRRYGISLADLREMHRPSIAKFKSAIDTEVGDAKKEGFERGRMESELRHLYLSNLGFGKIGRGADVCDKAGVSSIIDGLIRLGGKFPGTNNLRQIRELQSELEPCSSSDEVVALLEENRGLICEAFGVRAASFDGCIVDIKALDLAENTADSSKAIMRLHESLILIDENGSRNERH